MATVCRCDQRGSQALRVIWNQEMNEVGSGVIIVIGRGVGGCRFDLGDPPPVPGVFGALGWVVVGVCWVPGLELEASAQGSGSGRSDV